MTVERSLTILWPFVFQSQTMRKRSGYVILVIVLLQLLAQYQTSFAHNFTQHTCYFLRYDKKRFERMIVALVLTLLVPFIVIVVFNAATVFTLCRNRLRRNTVSGTRDCVSVFTKLTLIAGLSFVFSFARITYYFVIRFT